MRQIKKQGSPVFIIPDFEVYIYSFAVHLLTGRGQYRLRIQGRTVESVVEKVILGLETQSASLKFISKILCFYYINMSKHAEDEKGAACTESAALQPVQSCLAPSSP